MPRQLEENVQVAKAPVNAKQKVLAALDMQGEAVALLKHQGKHLRPVLVLRAREIGEKFDSAGFAAAGA